MTDNPNSPHSTDAAEPDEVFEQMARNAGAALRRPAPSDGVARLQAARRRQQLVRTSIAAGASAIFVVIGLIVVTRPSDRTIAPGDSPDPSTAFTTAATTASSTTTTALNTTTTTPEGVNLAFTFAGVDGFTPIGNPQYLDYTDYTTLISAWSSTAGITDSYLVLREQPRWTGTTSVEGDMTSVTFEVPDGHAFMVTDNGPDGLPMTPPSATDLWWWRGDGRLWIVSHFGLTAERLKELTLAIQPGSGLPYVLPDPAMTFVGFSTPDSFESVRQDWKLDGSLLTLAVTTGGLAQQLADFRTVSVVERTIAGVPGYAITRSSGQVTLVWPTDHADHWASVAIYPPLTDRLDEIVAAITPA